MKQFLPLFILLLPFFAVSQEQLGLRLENYAGVSSLALNPTGNLTSPLPWDLNIAGAGLYFENNYGLIKNTNTIDLLKNRENLSFALAEDASGNVPNNIYLLDFKDDDKTRFLVSNVFIAGPSLSLKVHENHSVGVFANIRAMMSALDFPNEFSYYDYDNREHFEPFQIKPFSGAFITWSEIGVNYAAKMPTYFGSLGFGINAKYLTGYEAAYLESEDAWTHTKLPSDMVIAESTDGNYGLTTSNLKSNGFEQSANGKGWGIDVGVMATISEHEDGYKWRLSASLLDIGSIKFNKNAQTHAVHNPSGFQLNLRDFDDFELLEETEAFLQHFSNETLGDSFASASGSDFKLALPTAISLQADYYFGENIYLNSFLIHHFPTSTLGPKRETLLALTPRYEHQWFSVSMPISMLNWEEMQMGLAARLGYLVIGTDKWGSLFGKSNYSGTDIYIALKLNQLRLDWGIFNGGGGSGKRKYGNGKKAKCYDF